MHADELEVSAELVRRLLDTQFPALADERIERVPSWGTVNAMFRVGGDALARMPFTPTLGDPSAEAVTLRRLGERLSVRIPRVLGLGTSGEGYPRDWLLLDWIPGRAVAPGSGGRELADDVARFLRSLWKVPTDAAPAAYRGGSLRRLDTPVRECLAEVRDLVAVDALLRVWEVAVAASGWDREPVWAHSDLLAGNLLVDERGRLSAVLDWESAGTGDPACDLMVAWSVLGVEGRDRLRTRPDIDEATWRRGAGWALAQAAIALPYYRESNPGMARQARHMLDALASVPGG